MIWWYWLVLGLVLSAIELFAPSGFYLLFFGLSALVIGTASGFELLTATWVQWLGFSLLSITSVALLRGPLLQWIKPQIRTGNDVDTMVGEIAVLLQDLSPGAVGKAELRGAAWNVRNTGLIPLTKGQRSKVEQVDGLMLLVKPE